MFSSISLMFVFEFYVIQDFKFHLKGQIYFVLIYYLYYVSSAITLDTVKKGRFTMDYLRT